MLGPHPRGHAEDVVRRPVEPLAADDRIAAAARDIIDDVAGVAVRLAPEPGLQHLHMRSEEHTSELQSLMRISYAVFCLKKKKSNIKYYTLFNTHQHLTKHNKTKTVKQDTQ